MLSFKQYIGTISEEFLFEELSDSQKKVVNSWTSRMKKPPAGPTISSHLPFDEHGRMDMDLQKSNTPPLEKKDHVSPEVADHLKSKGYTAISSTHATDESGKRTQRIGKLLGDNPELQQKHAKAGTSSAKGGDYKIEIRRDPKGVAEMSSGNKQSNGENTWTSCMRIPDKESHIKSEQEGGQHHHIIKNDIKHGTHVAYLHRNGKRIGRIALKPFVSPSGHTVLRPEPKVYGKQDENGDFEKTVKNWSEKNFPMKDSESHYTIHPDLYDDANLTAPKTPGPRATHFNKNLNSENLHKILKNGEENVAKELIKTHKSLKPEHLESAIQNKNLSVVTQALSHPSMPEHHINNAINSMDYRKHEGALQNPNVSKETISNVLQLKNKKYGDNALGVAIRHKKANQKDLENLLTHPSASEYVKRAASNRIEELEKEKKEKFNSIKNFLSTLK